MTSCLWKLDLNIHKIHEFTIHYTLIHLLLCIQSESKEWISLDKLLMVEKEKNETQDAF